MSVSQKKGRCVIDCCVCLFVTRGMFLPRERMNAVEKFKRELITFNYLPYTCFGINK